MVKMGVSVSIMACTKLPCLHPCKITVVHTTPRHTSGSNSYCGSFATPLTLIHFTAICNLLLLLLIVTSTSMHTLGKLQRSDVKLKICRVTENTVDSTVFFPANYGTIPFCFKNARYSVFPRLALLTYIQNHYLRTKYTSTVNSTKLILQLVIVTRM